MARLPFLLASTGRAFFNLLVPYPLEPYYRLGHPREWVGLALLVASAGLLGHRFWKVSRERRRWFLRIFSLAWVFYLPNAKVFLGYGEFVWSDRYLYLSLPFLVLALLLLLIDPNKMPAAIARSECGGRWFRPAMALTTAIAATYWVLDWPLVARWHDSRLLFETCSREERSPKCLAMAIEKDFDQAGCALVPEMLTLARQIAPQASNVADHSFQAETPVYEALCIAEASGPTHEKLRELSGLRRFYAMTDFLMLGEIFIRLQTRDLDRALAIARASYFDPKLPLPNASTKIINMMRGQGEALCVLSELVKHDKSCWDNLALFRARVSHAVLKPKQVTWTFNRTLVAFNTGQ